jgi:hypothetical protein
MIIMQNNQSIPYSKIMQNNRDEIGNRNNINDKSDINAHF